MSDPYAFLLTLSAQQSPASALRMLTGVDAQAWLVVVREVTQREQPYLYAYRAKELLEWLNQRSQADRETLEVALDLHEWASSEVADRMGKVLDDGKENGFSIGAARRVIVDETQRPVEVIERVAPGGVGAAAPGARTRDGANKFIARNRPTKGSPTGNDGPTVDVWLHGRAPQTLRPGADDVVEVIVARNGPVLPGVAGLGAKVRESKPITVLLSVLGVAVQVVGPRVQRLDVPAGDARSVGAFEIHAVQSGMVELALVFRQDSSELGQLRLVLHVGADAPLLPRSDVQAAAQESSAADASILWLDVEPQVAGPERRYRYRVTSQVLELDHMEFSSPVLLDKDGGAAASELAFIQRLYARLSNKVFRSSSGEREFDDELKATAEDLCQQLLPSELLELLWNERERIGTIRLMSWEPHVPWELLRLHQPKCVGADSDGRYLGEYGVVRWLSGRSAVRELALADWSFLAATYPNNPADDVVQDVAYFTQTLPQRHIVPARIPASYDALSEALEKPAYDVLHLACHGEAAPEAIDEAILFITDEVESGGRVRPVGMSAAVLGRIARLQDRRPLVFLNACSAGRTGMSLTAWGGWPKKLIDRGAGAVVGASWPVRDKVSNTFATAFYDALIDGNALADATRAARSAAMTSGDATWLAFKVFGDPNARRRKAGD